MEPESRPLDCIPPMNEYIAFAGALGALTSELARRRDQGQVIPPGVAEVVMADIEDAAELGDADRLAWLWQNAPTLVGELLEHVRDGRQLPI